jgi:hypothetical protein
MHRTVSGRDHPSVGRLGPLPAIAHRITHNRRPPRWREHRQHSRSMGPRPPIRWRRTCRYVNIFNPFCVVLHQALMGPAFLASLLTFFFSFSLFKTRVAIATHSLHFTSKRHAPRRFGTPRGQPERVQVPPFRHRSCRYRSCPRALERPKDDHTHWRLWRRVPLTD